MPEPGPDRATFWDQVYSAKAENQVSWFQENPEPALSLIRSATPDRGVPILDMGGGASRLVDSLLAGGYTDLTVLDVSGVALERAKARLGPRAAHASWVAADAARWKPHRQWRVWHDRAAFHFLTDRAEQDGYIEALKQGTTTGATIIIATFAVSGPERCSGLPVQRYSARALSARLGLDFSIVDERTVPHATPFGTNQDFTFGVFRRQ
jgi:hypothetical protein